MKSQNNGRDGPDSSRTEATHSLDGISRVLLTAMDLFGEGYFLCDTRLSDCPIVYISQGFTAITRYTAEQVLGRNLSFLQGPGGDPAVMEMIQQAVHHNKPFRGELLCYRSDAALVWCEMTLNPVPAANGTPRYIAAVLVNITERKQREEQLKDTAARFRGMFENAAEGIYQSTPDGRYLAVNPALARMYGYERPGELLNTVSDIQSQIYLDPSIRERFKREIELTGVVLGFEYQVRRCDGKIIWISETARAVRGTNGDIRYYEGFIDDITPRKEAEAERARLEKQMLQAQKMEAIGTLAGGIAHDFNNILCAVLGYTELALTDSDITGLSRKNLESVLKSTNRAKDLVKQILTFSRRGEIERMPVKLGSIIKECIKLLNATLPASISLKASIETDEDVVVANATEIHQVLMNLGTNAAHAMRSRLGCIEFRLRSVELDAGTATAMSLQPGSHVELTVSDDGQGMNRETVARIFDPFFTTKPAGQGTGIGLALVHRIVTSCRGHIGVESHEGVGTTFKIHLAKSSRPAVATPVVEDLVLPGKRESILIVDDEIPILSMMQQRLRKLGYRVITRADSIEALKTFRAEPEKYHLVITDNTMPLLEGVELAERIGEIREDVPVILITGLNQLPDVSQSRHAARRAVMRKPVEFSELSRRLRDLLEK
jgi:PAS domain S-box-containing protein